MSARRVVFRLLAFMGILKHRSFSLPTVTVVVDTHVASSKLGTKDYRVSDYFRESTKYLKN
jgi:hypothetical protein